MEELTENCFREVNLLASHDIGQIERWPVYLQEKMSLKKQEGLYQMVTSTPLAMNLTRHISSDAESESFCCSSCTKETVNNKFLNQEGHQELR